MLKVQKFTFNPFQENTYIVYNEQGSALIVDPGCSTRFEQKEMSAFISEKGLKIERLLNTHCHIDHVLGNKYVFDTYKVQPEISAGEEIVLNSCVQVAQMYGIPYDESPEPIFIETSKIALGSSILEVLSIPGHSPDHLAFYSKDDGFVLGGDVLFRESIGRTDLPGGNMNTLLNSIRNIMFALPDETVVYAGHMEETTIGHEKKYNPFLR
jgi:glyoxylase-like metal-dependent hydrolase (beta-lactamase superfamily II)